MFLLFLVVLVLYFAFVGEDEQFEEERDLIIKEIERLAHRSKAAA